MLGKRGRDATNCRVPVGHTHLDGRPPRKMFLERASLRKAGSVLVRMAQLPSFGHQLPVYCYFNHVGFVATLGYKDSMPKMKIPLIEDADSNGSEMEPNENTPCLHS